MRSKAATRSNASVPSTIAPGNRFWSARNDPSPERVEKGGLLPQLGGEVLRYDGSARLTRAMASRKFMERGYPVAVGKCTPCRSAMWRRNIAGYDLGASLKPGLSSMTHVC